MTRLLVSIALLVAVACLWRGIVLRDAEIAEFESVAASFAPASGSPARPDVRLAGEQVREAAR